MKILVIDAQGGGIGKQLVAELAARLPDAQITAVGTNSAATANMLKAGAHRGATGENSVIVGCRHADVIMGSIGIIVADAMLGEITPAMASAIGASEARKVLVPINTCGTFIAGVEPCSMKDLITKAVDEIGK